MWSRFFRKDCRSTILTVDFWQQDYSFFKVWEHFRTVPTVQHLRQKHPTIFPAYQWFCPVVLSMYFKKRVKLKRKDISSQRLSYDSVFIPSSVSQNSLPIVWKIYDCSYSWFPDNHNFRNLAVNLRQANPVFYQLLLIMVIILFDSLIRFAFPIMLKVIHL